MTHNFPLEEFEILRPSKGTSAQAVMMAAMEAEIRTHAYEQGYKAGWDDAVRAESELQEHIKAEFSKNMQDLGFTFHEARVQVMSSLRPLLKEIIEKFLPKLAADSLGPMIIEELTPHAENATDVHVEIVVAPLNRAAIEPLLRSVSTIPLSVIDEPTLGEGQAILRVGKSETLVDLNSSIEKISGAINSLYSLNEKAMKHG